MTFKFVACAVLLLQTISAQVIGNMYGPGVIGPNLAAEAALAGALAPGLPYPANLPYPPNMAYEAPVMPCRFGLTLAELAANGKEFAVTSSSPIAPNGISVQSENMMFEGPLAVSGKMPFLGSVALEGPLPATGQGEVAYGCGNGNVGILAEELPGPVAVATYPGGPGPNPAGYNGMGPWGPYGPMY